MTASIGGLIPERYNQAGDSLFVMVEGFPDEAFDVILSLDPLLIGYGDETAPCMAISGHGECRRLAFHDGPHALLDDDDHLVTFHSCDCDRWYGMDVCQHVEHGPTLPVIDPHLKIRVYVLTGDVR